MASAYDEEEVAAEDLDLEQEIKRQKAEADLSSSEGDEEDYGERPITRKERHGPSYVLEPIGGGEPPPEEKPSQKVEGETEEEQYVTEPSGKMIPRAPLLDPDPDVNYLRGEELRRQIESEKPQEPEAATTLGEQTVTAPEPSIPEAPVKPEVRKAFPEGEAPRAQPSGQVVVPAPAKAPETRTGFPPGAAPTVEPDIDIQSSGYTKGPADRKPQYIIIHSSDGREQGDINTLTRGNVSSHYYTTKDGRVLHFVRDNDVAWHGGKVIRPEYSNSNTIGIEQEHVDGQPWSEDQVRATARTAADIMRRNPQISLQNILGHNDIAGERKQDPLNFPWDRFRKYVQDDLGGAPTVAARAEPSTKLSTGFYQDENPKEFVYGKATTFGDITDRRSYAQAKAAGLSDAEARQVGDSGQGATKLGGLYTPELYGVAVPQEALIARLGNSPTAWRRARVDIINPQTGQRIRVPIVDIGPGPKSLSQGILADFTPKLNALLNNTGDQRFAFKLVANAGPDVNKNSDVFANEQAAIAKGLDSSTLARAKVAPKRSYALEPVAPALGVALEQARQFDHEGQIATLGAIGGDQPNIVAVYKQLGQPIKGVSDAMRTDYQNQVKSQMVALMKEKFPNFSDQEAFDQAVKDPNVLDYGRDFWTQMVGHFKELAATTQMATGVQAEQLHLNEFLNQALPNSSDQEKHALLAQLYATPREARGPIVEAYIRNPQPGVPGNDPAQVVSALDRLSDPDWTNKTNAQIASAQQDARRDVTPDPRLKGTIAESIYNPIAVLPAMLAGAAIPPALAAQISAQERERIKAEHPEYSEAQVEENAARSTIVQLVGQEAAGALMRYGVGGVMERFGASLARSPVKAALSEALGQTAANTAIGAGTQVGVNVVTGEPITKDLGPAAGAAAIQGGVVGALHGAGRLLTPREAPPPPTTRPGLGGETVPAIPETGERGAPVRGAREETMATGGETVAPPEREVTPPPITPPREIVPQGIVEEPQPRPREEITPPVDEAAVERRLNERTARIYEEHGRVSPPEAELDPATLDAYRQESNENLQRAVGINNDPYARQVLTERIHPEEIAGRREHEAEMAGELARPSEQEHLLQAIAGAGGLPSPALMKRMAARGEPMSGEYARVLDAWKALSLDQRKALAKEGVTFNKLFSKTAETLDTFRDQLSQRPGFHYPTVGELLSEAEQALGYVRQNRRLYGKGGPEFADYPGSVSVSHGPEGFYAARRTVAPPEPIARPRGRARTAEEASREFSSHPGNWAGMVESPVEVSRARDPDLVNRATQAIAEAERIGKELGIGVRRLRKTARRDIYATFDANGPLVNLTRADLADHAASYGAKGEAASAHMRRILQEEFLHALDIRQVRDEYENSVRAMGDEPTYQGAIHYYNSHRERAVNELFAQHDRALAAKQYKTARILRNAIERGWGAYREGISEKELKKSLPDIRRDIALAGPENKQKLLNTVRFELMRQLIQAHRDGQLTETGSRTLAGRMLNWVRKIIYHMRRGAELVKGGQAGRMWQDLFTNLNAKADGLERIMRGEAPAAVKPELAKRPELRRQGEFDFGAEEPFALHTTGPPPGGVGRVRPPPSMPSRGKPPRGEWLRREARLFGLRFKGGESAMLDYAETRPLAQALRMRPSLAQKFGQRAGVTQLADAFNRIPARERPRVVKEFSDYVRAEQMRQPLPAVSADTQTLLTAGKHTLEQLGQIAKELDVHVRTSDGKTRPMKLIGRNYFPRMISDDVHDIFNNRDAHRAAEFNAIVNDQIAQGKVKSRDEFIDKFSRAASPDMTSNAHFANVEKAREADLPLNFYDFSPEALLKYADRATDRLAQIGAYGQKLSAKGKDVFDHTIEQVQKMPRMTQADRQAIINRIVQERRAEYRENERSNFAQPSSVARNLATGSFLGNPITSLYNVISGAAQNLAFGGPGAFAKTAAKFLTIKGAMDNIKDARERNILKSNLMDILHDYDLVTDQNWMTKGARGYARTMLHWSGQNLTESINRAFALQQGKYILNRFARIWGQDNAQARSLYAMIQRRGIKDLNGLAREKGTGPLTDEFLRQLVMDTHGNYGPSQSAAHIFETPVGKVLTQFQKWGANTQRMATREFIMPLARSIRERKPADFAYQLMRNIGYLATATGSGVLAQQLTNFLRGRDPKDPTIQEIWKRFAKGDSGRATQMALQRAWGAIILSGFTGTIGNYQDLWSQLGGSAAGGRVKDPLHPPALGVIQPWLEFAQGWNGENNFKGPPSAQLLNSFAQSMSSLYRTGSQIGLNATHASGLRWSPAEEYAAKNDLSFLRNRVRMFAEESPVFQEKRAQKGTRAAPIMAGRGPFDPYGDDIQAALLTGNAEAAKTRMADWLDRIAPGDQKAETARIKARIQAQSPIKPEGSYKLESQMDFLRWAKTNLPEAEARRIFATARTYAKTAIETGLFDRSKTMNQIANLDYDKFVIEMPKAEASVKVVRPEDTIAAKMRREIVAKKLQMTH